MKIEEIKKGQKFKMVFGDTIWTAKCIVNNPEKREIGFSLRCFFGLIPFGISEIRSYNSYCFDSFEYLNS